MEAMIDLHWRNEDVAHEFILEPDPMTTEYAVHVFIFKDLETLRRARDRPSSEPEASAASVLYDEPDSRNTIALIMLAADTLELSLVVHEVTHVALHIYSLSLAPNATARAHITNHSEFLPELIGNLSAMVWFNTDPELRAL